jgi:RNA polymerase sigma-70 factor (ECF subfamily)
MNEEHGLSEALARDLDGHFEQLVVAFQDRLYGFALRLLGSTRDAEESTQDAFVRAYRALQGYSAERRRALHLRAWLFQITLNVVRNRVRRQALPAVPMTDELADVLPSNVQAEQPEQASLRRERLLELSREIAALPERYAAAVVLRHVQGLSYEETASILNQPVGTTKSDVHRGLRLLRDSLGGGLVSAKRAS